MTQKIVINADDLGMSPGANAGILEAYKNGVLTSSSVIVTTQYYREAIENIIYPNPDLGVGLHLSLTAGQSVSNPKGVKLLVDNDGYFKLGFSGILSRFRKSKKHRNEFIKQIELELESQFKKILSDGISIDHVDSERHIHLIPPIFDIVCRLSKMYGVNYIRIIRDPAFNKVGFFKLVGSVVSGGIFKYVILSYFSKYNRKKHISIKSADYFFSILHTGKITRQKLKTAILSAREGVTEIMLHPGMPDLNGMVNLRNKPLEKYLSSPLRLEEMRACIEAKSIINGDILTNYRMLSVYD